MWESTFESRSWYPAVPKQSEYDALKFPTDLPRRMPSYYRHVSPTTSDSLSNYTWNRDKSEFPNNYKLDYDYQFQTGSLGLSLQREPESYSSSSSPSSSDFDDDFDSLDFRYQDPKSSLYSYTPGLSGDDLETTHKNSPSSVSDSPSPRSIDSTTSWSSTDLPASAGFIRTQTKTNLVLSNRGMTLPWSISGKSASSVDSGVCMLLEDDIKPAARYYKCGRCSRRYRSRFQLSWHLNQGSCYVCCGERFTTSDLLLDHISDFHLCFIAQNKEIENNTSSAPLPIARFESVLPIRDPYLKPPSSFNNCNHLPPSIKSVDFATAGSPSQTTVAHFTTQASVLLQRHSIDSSTSDDNSSLPTKPTPLETTGDKQVANMSPVSTTGSDSCSPLSDYETDLEEDEGTGTIPGVDLSSVPLSRVSSSDRACGDVISRILSPVKQELLDRMMTEFWVIFNQENDFFQRDQTSALYGTRYYQSQGGTNSKDSQGGSSTDQSNQKTEALQSPQKSTSNESQKRRREDQNGRDEDDDEERNPKKPKIHLSTHQRQDDSTKFACPYRKRNPGKYCVRDWRPCALTPLENVARVKAHLYRHHRIFPCQRCKRLFKTQEDVNEHLKEPEPCPLRDIAQTDGLTSDIVEKLRSRKKSDKNQSDEDRWGEIYKLLFPHEIMVPGPYFEEVQENHLQSPDSQELANYEDYCRQELPRAVRAALEQVIGGESNPLEGILRNQLVTIIRDCQDRVFASYRESAASSVGTPIRTRTGSIASIVLPHSPGTAAENSPFAYEPVAERPSAYSVPSYLQPPPPQSHLGSHLGSHHPFAEGMMPPHENRPVSDSGYGSSASPLNGSRKSSAAGLPFEPVPSLATALGDVSLSQSFTALNEAFFDNNYNPFELPQDNGGFDGDTLELSDEPDPWSNTT